MSRIGPDVSHHQRTIDWEAVARQAAWATVKATEGAHVADPRYIENVAGARKAGLPAYAYHYAHADEKGAGPAEQAAHYLDVAGHLAAGRAILDWEGPHLRLRPADQAAWILDWFTAAAPVAVSSTAPSPPPRRSPAKQPASTGGSPTGAPPGARASTSSSHRTRPPGSPPSTRPGGNTPAAVPSAASTAASTSAPT